MIKDEGVMLKGMNDESSDDEVESLTCEDLIELASDEDSQMYFAFGACDNYYSAPINERLRRQVSSQTTKIV